jgi:endonuclease/exonuclease/phosphatase family metal-dependent hydrolase
LTSAPARRALNRLLPAFAGMILIGFGLWLIIPRRSAPAPPGTRASAQPQPAEGYLFCHWNVENFFDDVDDPKNHDQDEDWFAQHPELVRLKVSHLAEALLLQNGGRGPDIVAMVEVESRRAVELLRDALNNQLPARWHYSQIAQRPYRLDRRLAPAVLSRVPIHDDQTRLFPNRRILEVHLEAQGAPLVLYSSHWTSRLRAHTEGKRDAYADALYAAVSHLARDDPQVDALLAGDFNDEPTDASVAVDLHATGNVRQVRDSSRGLQLLDLMTAFDPAREGTYSYNGHWEILDHIVASPGLLDPTGWLVETGSTRIFNPPKLRFGRRHQPWRFGGPDNQNPPGYSDHFSVNVRLRVQAAAGARR